MKPRSFEGPVMVSNAGDSLHDGMILVRQALDQSSIKDKRVSRCVFEGITFKAIKIHSCRFVHSRFSDCYFKDATFNDVEFIDCFFERCDFDGATFTNCGLEYSEFDHTKVEYRQIQDCLPKWDNVRFRLARSLRKNAESMGDSTEYRLFLRLELTASETHLWNTFTKFDGYYKKYRPIDRIRALRKWIGMTLDRLVWGYGENWTRLVALAAIIVAIFAFAFRYTSAQVERMPGTTLWHFFAFSASSFLTVPYQEAVASNWWAQFLVCLEAALGLVVFGFLITSLYVRTSRR
jgi:Pentapeptide repeats (9 copies)